LSLPLLVLVSGPPGAGKTTLAAQLAPRLRLPLVAKDDIKESLFDALGWSDLEWSRKLGRATWDAMFVLMERFLSAGASAIFESNFYPQWHRERLTLLHDKAPFTLFEVYCIADPATLARRNNERNRHPGHHWSSGITPQLAATWATANAPLDLGPHLLRLDTSDPESLDLDGIIRRIEEVRDGTVADG
jgi:predicted kinase